MRYLLLSLCMFFMFSNHTSATHLVGADISWKCLSNGQYQFHLTVYRDCSGIPWSFSDETIQIDGFPLPTDSGGNAISSILVSADSALWSARGMGNIAPQCTDTALGMPACSIQEFYYVSDSINLYGKPPRAGWSFYWSPSCCTPAWSNISGTGSMLLRAIMYRNSTGSRIDSCFDSSPVFAARPTITFCRGKVNNFHQYAIDEDGDEVRHSFSQPYYSPISFPVPMTYLNGYGFKNPTPDTNFRSNNIPSSINLRTGFYNFSVHNGVGIRRYLTSVQADAYRDGKLIARVFRQLPANVWDCPTLADTSINTTPIIKLDSIEQNFIKVTATAGDLIKLPIQVIDPDTVNGIPQEVKLTAAGVGLAWDLSNENNCLDSNLKPCAYFQNNSFSIDTTVVPRVYTLIDSSQLNTELSWQTDCKHLNNDGSAKNYYFYLTAQDNVCPQPLSNAAVIQIRILPDTIACGLATSIEEIDLQEGLKVYPNPTKGVVSIRLNEHFQNASYSLRNINGQLIDQGEYMSPNRFSLEIPGTAGIYFLRLTNEKGEHANLKLVKH